MEVVKGRYGGKRYRIAHPKIIEAFCKFFYDSKASDQKELLKVIGTTKRTFRKKAKNMYMDEIMLYYGMLGGAIDVIFKGIPDAMGIKSLQQVMKIAIAKGEFMDKRLGDQHIRAYETSDHLKYISHLSNYQNSRWFLFNKDYKHLARSGKARKETHEFEAMEDDMMLFLRLMTGSKHLSRYMALKNGIDEYQVYILQLVAGKMDKEIGYQYLAEKTNEVMPKQTLDRSIGKLTREKFIHIFGSNENKTYVIASTGANAIKDAYDYANLNF